MTIQVIGILGLFALMVVLMMTRKLPTILALPIMAVGIALIADNPLTHREGLAFLHLKDPHFFRTLYLVWKKGKYLSPATKAFKYYVLSKMNER